MPSQEAMNAVLNLLQKQEYLPSELIKKLLGDGLSESDVKEAVAQLLHDQALELRPNRYLHAATATAA